MGIGLAMWWRSVIVIIENDFGRSWRLDLGWKFVDLLTATTVQEEFLINRRCQRSSECLIGWWRHEKSNTLTLRVVIKSTKIYFNLVLKMRDFVVAEIKAHQRSDITNLNFAPGVGNALGQFVISGWCSSAILTRSWRQWQRLAHEWGDLSVRPEVRSLFGDGSGYVRCVSSIIKVYALRVIYLMFCFGLNRLDGWWGASEKRDALLILSIVDRRHTLAQITAQ